MTPSEQVDEFLHRLQTRWRRLQKYKTLTTEQAITTHTALLAMQPGRLLAQPVAESRFVVIDTETTGLHAYRGDEIVSIALIEMQGLEITAREYLSLVNPGRDIPEDSARIHGLHDADVADAPSLVEILPVVVEFIGESVLVGHHTAFDLRFLNKALRHHLLTRLPHPVLDTMQMFLELTGRYGHYTLEEVAEACRVTVEGRHTARGDALVTAHVFVQLAQRLTAADAPVRRLFFRGAP